MPQSKPRAREGFVITGSFSQVYQPHTAHYIVDVPMVC